MKFHREWIEQIVLEVVQRIETTLSQSEKYNKPCLLIFFSQQRPQQEVDEIIHFFQKDRQVITWPTNDKDTEHMSLPEHINKAMFMDVNQDLIIRGALGLTGTPASEILSILIHRDVPVSLVPSKELHWILEKSNKQSLTLGTKRYREGIVKHKENLQSYGVTFQKRIDLHQKVLDENDPAYQSDHVEVVTLKKKLLAEQDIHAIHASVILVPPKAIITPLARDVAKNKGIEIRVQD